MTIERPNKSCARYYDQKGTCTSSIMDALATSCTRTRNMQPLRSSAQALSEIFDRAVCLGTSRCLSGRRIFWRLEPTLLLLPKGSATWYRRWADEGGAGGVLWGYWWRRLRVVSGTTCERMHARLYSGVSTYAAQKGRSTSWLSVVGENWAGGGLFWPVSGCTRKVAASGVHSLRPWRQAATASPTRRSICPLILHNSPWASCLRQSRQ